MVAGILEKSKRLRKAFVFIVKKLPISCAAEGRVKPRNVGRLSRRGVYQCAELKSPEPEKTTGRLQGQVFPQTPTKAFRPS
jgi:hypothetical protein